MNRSKADRRNRGVTPATEGRTLRGSISISDTLQMVPVDNLKPYPNNPRKGDVGAISESIRILGFTTALTVQRSTSYILIGNHRYLAALHLGMTSVPVIYVDCDDDAARRILANDNATSDLASNDVEELVKLLEEIADTDFGLEGMAFTSEDLDEMVHELGRIGQSSEKGKNADSGGGKAKTGEESTLVGSAPDSSTDGDMGPIPQGDVYTVGGFGFSVRLELLGENDALMKVFLAYAKGNDLPVERVGGDDFSRHGAPYEEEED